MGAVRGSRWLAWVVGGGILLGVGPSVTAAEYPVKGKPITIIVPWAAGGNADTFTRVLQPALRRRWEPGWRSSIFRAPARRSGGRSSRGPSRTATPWPT